MSEGDLFHNPTPTPTKAPATSKRRRRRATATIPPHLRCDRCGGERAVWFKGRAYCPVCEARELFGDEPTADPADGVDVGDATERPTKGANDDH